MLKNQKGITLLVLSITIVVMMILTFTLTTNVGSYAERKRKTNFEADIGKIKEKIEIYYSRNKEIPIANKYTNTSMITPNANDNENYYVLDLSKIEISDLNYGQDYYKIENKAEEISNLEDIYIINEQSTVVYYPKGISFDGKMYYTLDVASTKIEDIKIESIAITGENVVEIGKTINLKATTYPSFVESSPIEWTIDNTEIASISSNGELTGIKYGTVVVTATLKENPTIKQVYTVQVEYPIAQLSLTLERNSTINGETPSYKNPIIPQGFKAVDTTTGDSTISSEATWKSEDGYKYGLVIEDENKNQFVWVPCVVNRSDVETGDTVVTFQKTTAGKYNVANFALLPTDTTVPTEDSSVQEIRESVEKYQGFYIARYEAGIEEKVDNNSLTIKVATDGSVKPLSQAKKGVWNCVTRSEAIRLSKQIVDSSNTTVKSTLISGEAWDTTLAWMTLQDASYAEDSSKKGWYAEVSSNTVNVTGYYAVNNIYDMAGNVCEWTTENCKVNGQLSLVARGGYYGNEEAQFPAAYRGNESDVECFYIGFRPILYVQ